MTSRWHSQLAAVAALVVFASHATLAVDVKVNFEKTFDFKNVRTWGWSPHGAGDVKMARSQDDNPEAAKAKAEPLIVDAVTKEMAQRGIQFTKSSPDVVITYFLLLSTNISSQTVGQFLPATTMWGIPPFAPATQSLEVMNEGSLVLDASANEKIIWRGIAEAKLKTDADDKKREAVLREAVRDLLRKFPTKN
jgi:Domain of unknown function (DUF4136)